MRRLLLLLVACPFAAAGEPDGAVAAAARWSGPAGPASGSFRSAAVPVMGDVAEAWSLDPKHVDVIEAPPVLWDGRGFVLGSGPKGRFLVAFDVRTGKELGRKTILSRSALDKWSGHVALHVWDHVVFVEQSGKDLKAYRFERRRFRTVWTYRKLAAPHTLAVCENEVYAPIKDAFIGRLRLYRNLSRWEPYEAGAFVVGGRPAIYGPLVFMFVIKRHPVGKEFYLIGLRRRDGRMFVRKRLGAVRDTSLRAVRPGRVSVTAKAIYIESRFPIPTKTGDQSHLMIPCRIRGETVEFTGTPGVGTFQLPPAHYEHGTLLLSVSRATWKHRWMLGRGKKQRVLSEQASQPDLFQSLVPPTILGDIVYFGTYAVDMVTGEILWRLPIKEVRFAAVPADGLVIVVDGGNTLRAYAER